MTTYLGIDAGTSSVKGLLVEADGHVLDRLSIAVATDRPHEAWAEQSAQALVDAVRAIGYHFRTAEISAIGIVGQTPSLVFVSPAGRPVGPILIWQDTRASMEAEELSVQDASDLIGMDLPWTAAYPPAKLLWLARHQPEIVRETAIVLQPKDFLGFTLTGAATSDCWSSKGLCRIDTCGPASDLLNRLGWRDEVCPPVGPPWSIRGRITAEGAARSGLPVGTAVAVGWSDALAAMLAVGAFERPAAFILAGTSDIVGRSLKVLPSTSKPLLAVPDSIAPLPVVYGPTQASGGSLAWLADLLATPISELLPLIGQPGRVGPVFLPYLQGERAPIWNDSVRGAFLGLDITSGRSELITAVAFGIASTGRHVLESVQAAAADRPGAIVAAGPGAAQDEMCLVRAAIHGRPLHCVSEPDVSALGAAMLGAAASEGQPVTLVARRMRPAARAVQASPGAVKAADNYYVRYRNASDLVLSWS